ncbi:hypothetical protein Bca52824_005748 [Brassica carinata]|uniref:Uncharacterized protein n=1 Tax=Brassica carinata TaxID=52824 RepID=A0A8X8BH79_BRACI|nr:hypothetical protein Bca52824_005748 [Brassica carinata]
MEDKPGGDKGDDYEAEESDDDKEEEHEDKTEKPKQSNVPLLVTLSKKTGPRITPSMINFLHEYMINKDSKDHLLWLKTLKNFVKS